MPTTPASQSCGRGGGVYPGLFLPFSRMPPEMRAHLRYPQALFAAQAEVYSSYHADEPTAFWNGADAWQLPRELAGPVERAGRSASRNRRRMETGRPAEREMQSRYLLARLPGDATERFMLVTPFTPRGRQNLVSYLAGSVDVSGHATHRALSLPRDRLTLGPTQAIRRILASSQVNQRLQIVNRESSDLGKAAVSRTILGAPRVVPVGDALIHVQPVYVIAGGDGVPRLQLVTVQANGRVGYGRDLESALSRRDSSSLGTARDRARNRRALVHEHVDCDCEERQGERQPRHDGGQQELEREQPQHDRRVAAAQAKRDQRSDRVERHADRQEQLDSLPSGHGQRAGPGAHEVGDGKRAKRQRVLAHGAG